MNIYERSDLNVPRERLRKKMTSAENMLALHIGMAIFAQEMRDDLKSLAKFKRSPSKRRVYQEHVESLREAAESARTFLDMYYRIKEDNTASRKARRLAANG